MSITTEQRPVNGHRVALPEPGGHALTAAGSGRAPEAGRDEVAALAARRDTLARLREIDTDPVFTEVRSPVERDADRVVAEKIRARARRERLRAGLAGVGQTRRERVRARWDDRANRARDRRLDPARNLTSDYRRYVGSVAVVFALITGGVAWMSATVHDGLVGAGGTWLGYLVEPLASVLLVVSMVAQLTAYERGQAVSRGFVAFDAALAGASLLLNVVPAGIRDGFSGAAVIAHVLAPLLIVAAVVAYHLITALYGRVLETSKTDPELREQLRLVRGWIADGTLPATPSRSGIERALRGELGRVTTRQAQRIARHLLGT